MLGLSFAKVGPGGREGLALGFGSSLAEGPFSGERPGAKAAKKQGTRLGHGPELRVGEGRAGGCSVGIWESQGSGGPGRFWMAERGGNWQGLGRKKQCHQEYPAAGESGLPG